MLRKLGYSVGSTPLNCLRERFTILGFMPSGFKMKVNKKRGDKTMGHAQQRVMELGKNELIALAKKYRNWSEMAKDVGISCSGNSNRLFRARYLQVGLEDPYPVRRNSKKSKEVTRQTEISYSDSRQAPIPMAASSGVRGAVPAKMEEVQEGRTIKQAVAEVNEEISRLRAELDTLLRDRDTLVDCDV